MNNFVYPFDITDIDAGCADDQARQLLDGWRNSNGFLCAEVVNLAPVLVVFGADTSSLKPPTIFSAGPQALSTRLLGSHWAETPETANSTFEDPYKYLVADGYHRAAIQNIPVFDLISAQLSHTSREIMDLRYQRLILPFSTPQGATFLICYSMKTCRIPLIEGLGTNGKPLQFPELQNEGRASPFAPAVSAISPH